MKTENLYNSSRFPRINIFFLTLGPGTSRTSVRKFDPDVAFPLLPQIKCFDVELIAHNQPFCVVSVSQEPRPERRSLVITVYLDLACRSGLGALASVEGFQQAGSYQREWPARAGLLRVGTLGPKKRKASKRDRPEPEPSEMAQVAAQMPPVAARQPVDIEYGWGFMEVSIFDGSACTVDRSVSLLV